jgi:hypothetical protein
MATNNISDEEKKRQKEVMAKTKFRTFDEFLDLKHKEDEEFAKSKVNKSLGKVTGLDASLDRINQQADLTNEALKASSGYVDKVKNHARKSAADKKFGDFVDTKISTEQVGDIGDLARYRKSLGKTTKDGLNVFEGQGKFDPDAEKLAQQNYERNVELHGEKFANKERKKAAKQAKRNIKKLKRQDKRATKIARRKGMSKDQAKDFMANRRDRLNNALREGFKGVLGGEQNLDNIKDRYWRKDKSGTIQNQKTKDGKTIDATAPFQGEGLEQTNRGGTQTRVREAYDALLPKTNVGLPTYDFKKFTNWTPPTPEETAEKNTRENIETSLNPEKTQGNNFASDFLFPRSKEVDTIGLGNRSYLTHNESSQGKYNNPKNILNNLVDSSKVDKNGLQTAMDEIILNKALSGSGNVSFNDNFAGKYGNVGGMNKSNYDINLLNPSGGIKPFKPLRNAIKNSNFFNKNSKKKN